MLTRDSSDELVHSLIVPREVCEGLERLGDEGEVAVGLLSGKLVGELKEAGGVDYKRMS